MASQIISQAAQQRIGRTGGTEAPPTATAARARGGRMSNQQYKNRQFGPGPGPNVGHNKPFVGWKAEYER